MKYTNNYGMRREENFTLMLTRIAQHLFEILGRCTFLNSICQIPRKQKYHILDEDHQISNHVTIK